MFRIVLLSALAALSAGQQYNQDPRNAAILQEERYLSIDGKFGAAYEQEDGVQFKEESDADGTRRGSYSYVDPSGQRRTISYVAGKNGFQPTGDHLPAVPAPVVNPQPQYNSPPQSQPQPQYSAPARQFGGQSEDDGQWIDDTRQEYPANSPATASLPSWSSNAAPQPSWNSNAAPQPSWNSNAAPQPQPSWNSNAAPQPSWNSNPAPQQSWASNPTPAPAPAPVYNQPQQQPQRWSAPADPTPAPHRYFPPGKLSLNRSPDGFSFSFNKS